MKTVVSYILKDSRSLTIILSIFLLLLLLFSSIVYVFRLCQRKVALLYAPVDQLSNKFRHTKPGLKDFFLKQRDTAVFLYQFFRNPSTMGAAFPSSKRLANYMAAQVHLSTDGVVIELGAGTGVVTAALLRHKIAPQRLFVVEQSAIFANHLRKTFPQLHVIEGDATHLTELLNDPTIKIDAIVSSLPLLSLPAEVVQKITHQIGNLLDKNGHFIQFTYNLDKKNIKSMKQLELHSSHIIWLNIPPACVHVFAKH